jgi:peptidoglycan/xylan/chitin deacetylase (PgdA/CDA1 family)
MLKRKYIKPVVIFSLVLVLLVCMVGCVGSEDTASSSRPSDGRLVCLFFDDAYWNQYQMAFPVLLKHDFKATFGVITGHIGLGHDLWEYMDERELSVLAENGMAIASHTKTHPYLTDNLTDEQLREEIIESKEHLESLGFEVDTFIYPYYKWDDNTIRYVRDAGYTCARAGWSEDGSYNLSIQQPDLRYHFPAWQITDQEFDDFKTIIDKAGSNRAVSLVYHFITDDGPEGLATPVENFREQMSYLKKNNFTVVLMADLLGQ